VDDPEPADHREADPVGEEVLALTPERVGEAFAVQVGRYVQIEDEQRDRDREDAVAEGDDPRELDLVLLTPLRRARPRHRPIIEPRRDGTAARPT
jgi:hypothetical protein